MGTSGREITGDVAVSRNVTAGGDGRVRGSLIVGHNLRVDGWLDAPNIKAARKGLFASAELLNEHYPAPRPGWWALVGNTLPAELYVEHEGKWVSTGNYAGELRLPAEGFVTVGMVGAPDGVAPLGPDGKIPAEYLGDRDPGFSIGRTSGLFIDPESGRLYVNTDGSTIVIDRKSGKLCVDAANLPLKTVNGESIIATPEDTDITISGGSGSGLTEWQEQYLKGLEEQEMAGRFAVTLSANPSDKETDGTATTIQLTARAAYDGQPVAAAFSFANDSELTIEDSQLTGVRKASYVYPVPAARAGQYSKSFRVTASYTRNGRAMSKTATATFELYARARILQTAGTAAPEASAIAAASVRRTDIRGSYAVPIEAGRYVWLCVPSGAATIRSITSSGFAVPFEAPVTVAVAFGAQTVDYECYRLSGAPETNPMQITVA